MRLSLRHTAIVTASTLIVALSSAGMSLAEPSPPGADATEDPALVNSSFEEASEDGSIPGWTPIREIRPDAYVEVSDAVAYEGERSLRLVDDSDTYAIGVESDPFTVEPGAWYSAQAMMNVERDTLVAILRFYDADGNRLTQVAGRQPETAGEWATTSASEVAPDGATTGTVILYSATGQRGLGHVDSVSLSVEPVHVVNPSFEDVTADGEIVGWVPRTPRSPELYSLSQERASDGQNSIHMHDDDPELGGSLISDPIPVEAGREYTFSFDQYLISGALTPFMYFEDADGQKIDHTYERIETTPGQWERASITGYVPEGAVQIRLLVNSSVSGVVESYVDNVDLQQLPPKGTEEDLGAHTGRIQAQTTGLTTDSAGRTIALFGSNGQPVVFSAVDVSTGERLMQQNMPGASMTWSYASAADGTTYIGTSRGGLWQFDPDALTLEQIQDDPLGETHLYSMDMHDDGRVFIGTYPGGKVLSYDPSTDEWDDHGAISGDVSYAKKLVVEGDTVYVGSQARIGLWTMDLTTGETTEIALPQEHQDETGINSLGVFGDTLFALTGPSRTLLVHDLATGEWTHSIDDVANRKMAEPRWVSTPDGDRYETYYQDRGSLEVRAFDLNTGEIRSVGFTIELNSMNWYWAEVDRDGFPGDSLVGTTQRGTISAWNPETDDVHQFMGDFAPSLAFVRSLNDGPDGNIYFGGYASHGLVRYSPDSGDVETLPGPGQMERLGSNGDDLMIGGYGHGAPTTDFDTTQPWEWGTNPGPWVYLGDEQERITAIEPVAPALTALGSYPVKGEIGGSLAFYDHEQRTTETYRNIIQDQTVVSLAYQDGLLYGGTSISTGLGTEPTTSEGHLFVYDVEKRELVMSMVPVAGDKHVARLAFDDDGILWGMTGTTLFAFDPQTREIVEEIVFDKRTDKDLYIVGREFEWVDDRFVGYSRCRLFEFDPSTQEISTLREKNANTCNGLGVDDQGRYYYGAGTHIFRWTPIDEATCDSTLTGTHDGTIAVTEGTTCVDGATVTGRVSVDGGARVVVTDSDVHGPIQATGADAVTIAASTITGPVAVTRATTAVTISDNEITGAVRLMDNTTDEPAVVAGNTIGGVLMCAGNEPAPTNRGMPNAVDNPRRQCGDLS